MTYDQVREMLFVMNLDLDNGQFDALMKAIDADGDGDCTYDEFMAFMRKYDPILTAAAIGCLLI